MLRYMQPSSWFFILIALVLGFYFSTKVHPRKTQAPLMAAPAVFVSFGR